MKTKLKLLTSFDECENEDLTRHQRIQPGCRVMVLSADNRCIGVSSNVTADEQPLAMEVAETISDWPTLPATVEFPGQMALAHQYADRRYLEWTPDKQSASIPSAITLPERNDNLYRFAQDVLTPCLNNSITTESCATGLPKTILEKSSGNPGSRHSSLTSD